jgi:hypothetical protein
LHCIRLVVALSIVALFLMTFTGIRFMPMAMA